MRYSFVQKTYGIKHFSEAQICIEQRALLRVDFNLPFSYESGEISDFTRVNSTIKTVRELLWMGAKIILISHLGEVKTFADRKILSFSRLIGQLSQYFYQHLDEEIGFLDDVIGESDSKVINSKISKLFTRYNIILLENLRFCSGEKLNDNFFAQALANLASVYINDAFSCAHRRHSSIIGAPKLLPAYAGSALCDELQALELSIGNGITCHKNKIAIIGGKKVSTKMPALIALSNRFDYLIIVGSMANTFLRSMGRNIGNSFFEEDLLFKAKSFMDSNKKAKVILPIDVVTSDLMRIDVTSGLDSDIGGREIFDIGEKTTDMIYDLLKNASAVVWNGPAGYYEKSPFDIGTNIIANQIIELTSGGNIKSVVGGGDTIAAIHAAKFIKKSYFTHITTGGGAFLEWIVDSHLPGIIALCN